MPDMDDDSHGSSSTSHEPVKSVIAKFLSRDTQLRVKTGRIRRKVAVVEFLFMSETVFHLFAKLTLWTIPLNEEDRSASP